jgi:hypothetical protein
MLKSLGLWGECEESKMTSEDTYTEDSVERAKSPVSSVKSAAARSGEEDMSEMSGQTQGCGAAVTTRVRQTAANLPAPLKQV